GISAFLNLSISNVGGVGAYNVAVTVSSAFQTASSSNYLGSVPSNSNMKTGVFLTVKNNTQEGSYLFNVNLTYTDITGQRYSSNQNYSVLIEPYTPPDVTISNILLDPPVLSQGVSGSVSIFLSNPGTTVAKNVTVRISGGNGIVSSNYFGLGTVAANGQVTQVIGVNVAPKLAPGSYTLYFNTTYSDPTGKVYSSIVPMQVTVYASSNLFSVANIVIIGVIVALALVAFIVLRKYKVV
ncbi:MAG: hypothetical protein JRN15_05370, partial [Nitrososphaerota archaeon]|nr:hypothetical protein [Nitrososphaerota archaeon]